MSYHAKLQKYWRGGMEGLTYLLVFLMPWQTKLIIRPSETNFTEISLYLRELVLLIILIIFFLSPRRLREELKKTGASSRPQLIFWSLLLMWWLFTAISVLSASDRLLALSRLGLLTAGLGLIYLFRNYFVGSVRRLKITYVFLGSLWLQAALGIYQFLMQIAPAGKYLGLAAHEPAILGTAVVETATGRWLRAYGGFDHPNIFGGMLALGLLVSAYLFSRQLGSSKDGPNWRLSKIWPRIFLLIFYFTSLTALFFTFSRGAWLGLIIGLLVLLIYFLKSPLRSSLWRFLVLIFFSLLALAIIAAPFQALITTRLSATTRLEEKSISERQAYLSQSLGLISQRGLLGVGAGNYVIALAEQDLASGQALKPAWNYQPVHNVFLLLFAESGLFALLAFGGLLLYLFLQNRRSGIRVAVLVGLIILMLFDHWLLSLPFGVLLLVFLFGLI